MEPISPELALVDPQLRAEAQARLTAAPRVAFTPRASRPAAPPAQVVEKHPRRGPSARALLLALPVVALLAALALVPDTSTQRPWLSEPAQQTATPGPPAPRREMPMEPAPGPMPMRPDWMRAPPPTPAATEPQTTLPQSAPPPDSGVAPAGEAPPPRPAPHLRRPPAPSTEAAPAPVATPEPVFEEVRTFAWAPAPRTSYYEIRFFRDERQVLLARSTDSRLELPAKFELMPGIYRWIVRPGYGTRAEGRLGTPIVDSTFTVGAPPAP